RKYALFDNDADVPSYERYVGENYAIYKIADRYAIWFSDEVLRSTGFPVIHRNYPLQSPLLHNVPVFQVIHAWLIATEQDKSSLATFLVPPFWPESMPQEGYPVLFSGHYDINSNSFVENGPIIIQVVGEVLNSGKGSALGILWNGGGASGPGTMQRSAYDNAAILFEMARDSLKINPNAIITFGGSRGGFTALAMAANPYHNNYRAVYALAYGPPVKGGEHLQRFQNTCYPRLMHCNDVTTGYSYSWRLGWKDPITGMSGRELYRYNLVGTIDYAYMDSFLFPASPFHLQALKDKGTRVLLSIGTHDAFMPLPLYFKYMDGLQKHEIPVRFEIFYRWGHTVSASIPDYLTYCLESILNGDTLNFPIGTFHYRRLNNDNPNECEEFFPAYQPIVLEAPKACAKPETVTISIIGDEGLGYDLLLWKINDSSLEKNQSVLKEFIAQRMQGVLPDSKFVVELLASADLDSGYYLYELFFSRDNINWIQIPSEYVPQPGEKGPPILQIFETEPMLSGYDVANILGKENRGWGLSSEHIDLPVTIGEVKQPVFNSRLFQNYPNPFNSSTIIYFSIPCQSRVMLKVFDKLGRRIATIMDKRLEGGRYSVPYDTKDLASGVYLCRLTTATFSQTRTMIVLK
ncbi:MAG: T9SS type A sorting domain-containing protein, partial [Nitrospirota bacterium]